MNHKYLFIDAEFTGEHQKTTPVSFGLVGMDGESLSVVFNDYDRDQVTPWLEEHVLAHLDHDAAVPRSVGWRRIAAFMEEYAGGERIALVSAGKLTDIILLFELWHFGHPERRYFHNLYCLPDYLNHAAHLDLNTMFLLAGIDPSCDRAAFADVEFIGRRHDSLYDARVVRACFLKLFNRENFPRLP
jgi:hypothetical protein